MKKSVASRSVGEPLQETMGLTLSSSSHFDDISTPGGTLWVFNQRIKSWQCSVMAIEQISEF